MCKKNKAITKKIEIKPINDRSYIQTTGSPIKSFCTAIWLTMMNIKNRASKIKKKVIYRITLFKETLHGISLFILTIILDIYIFKLKKAELERWG